jgi:hypothetical protein
MIKYFSERVSPAVHDSAARKEGFGFWKEAFFHFRFAEEEEKLKEEAKEKKLHIKTRGDMVIKLFSEKISPGVHDAAAVKEGFGVWKEESMHWSYLKRGKKIKKEQEKVSQRRLDEERRERELHARARSDMVVKYFSEKVSPGIHDVAAKKETVNSWKEQYMHYRFEIAESKREKKLRGDADDELSKQLREKNKELSAQKDSHAAEIAEFQELIEKQQQQFRELQDKERDLRSQLKQRYGWPRSGLVNIKGIQRKNIQENFTGNYHLLTTKFIQSACTSDDSIGI